jgi:histidine triad (HIT) family protein
VLFQDEQIMIFKDAFPVTDKHFLVIPKNRDGLTGISCAEERHAALLGHMLVCGARVAKE